MLAPSGLGVFQAKTAQVPRKASPPPTPAKTVPAVAPNPTVPVCPSVSVTPSQGTPPDRPHDWTPTAINFAQFLLLASLTYYIFRKNYRQKTMERQAQWYHRLVTDFAIGKLTEFAESASSALTHIAKEVAKLKAIAAPRGAIDIAIQRGLGDFKNSLYSTMALVSGRLLVFDKKLEQSLVDHCTDLEDGVTEWFNTEAAATTGEHPEKLLPLLNDWLSMTLKLIRDYEFEQWN